ncbi:TAXI family TRAP transporter solute-binding subunit [Pusillimonas sp.]|uniref:TAXI family TRAP transporter solute-binding subunit n=1 Tax=Pusillimonas sp. TaxID=3040095 RepID=UPI0029B5CB2C|nr:TAXI family TRAP transporter solute-binding subunit [Pusillimonas sp.]MDX3895445.1 TAXI family TRAP transporter solute-binding subunit [Pusillimonas sp.]
MTDSADPKVPEHLLLNTWEPGQPWIERSLNLRFIGDWGRANFHKICSWLCCEVADRSGSQTRVAIYNVEHGGWDSMKAVFDGEADLCVVTPTCILPQALVGRGIFEGSPMPSLRAIGVIPQDDRMLFAIDPAFGIKTMADLREKRPPIKISTSWNNGYNLIGYAAAEYLKAHDLSPEIIRSWGGEMIYSERPEQSLERAWMGKADAVLQEAIMMPWWRKVIDRGMVVVPAEEQALKRMEQELNWPSQTLEANHFSGQAESMNAMDFSDFLIVVRDDLPEDIAHLLTWCLVERRSVLEQQFSHVPSKWSPVNYPFDPRKMAQTSLPLHRGAERYYREAGYISAN